MTNGQLHPLTLTGGQADQEVEPQPKKTRIDQAPPPGMLYPGMVAGMAPPMVLPGMPPVLPGMVPSE